MLVGSFRIRILSFGVTTYFVTKWPNMPFSYELDLGVVTSNSTMFRGRFMWLIFYSILVKGHNKQRPTCWIAFPESDSSILKHLKGIVISRVRIPMYILFPFPLNFSIYGLYFRNSMRKYDQTCLSISSSRYASRFMVSPSAITFRNFFLYSMDNWRRRSLTLLHILLGISSRESETTML